MAEKDKLKSIEDISLCVENLKKQGKTIVLCHGEFDLFHPGHLRYLKGAKKEGDILVVTITPDRFINRGPGRPVFSEEIRAEFIAALDIVDFIGINQWPTAVELLESIKPDVYCKGAEYIDRAKDVTGRIAMEEKVITRLGGRMHFVEDITFSSSSLLNRNFQVYPQEAVNFINQFKGKHTIDEIISKINKIKDMNILIIGDTIIDEYHYCEALGKSPKSLNITTKFLSSEKFTGGVLASANHVAEFCPNVTLVTCIGDREDNREFIENHLNPSIKRNIFVKKNTPTTVKRRYVDKAFIGKMFEVCFLDDHEIDENLDHEICTFLMDSLAGYDCVIINDFGHGFISDNIIDVLTGMKTFLGLNVQANSANMGFNLITKYSRADYVCIDEPEIRYAMRNKHGDLNILMKNVYENHRSKMLAVTRGHRGSTVYEKSTGFADAPVLSLKIVDTVGAGDAFFAVTTPLAALGLSPEEIAFIGNAVGALAVLIVCNRTPVTYSSLCKFITAMLK